MLLTRIVMCICIFVCFANNQTQSIYIKYMVNSYAESHPKNDYILTFILINLYSDILNTFHPLWYYLKIYILLRCF